MDPEEVRLKVEENWGECCVATGGTRVDLKGAGAWVNTVARRAAGHSNIVLPLKATTQDYPQILDEANKLFRHDKLAYVFYASPVPSKQINDVFLSKGLTGGQDEQTYMIYASAGDKKERPRVDVRLVEPKHVDRWAEVIYTSFGWPTDTKQGWTESMTKAAQDERVRPLMAYIDDNAAGGLLVFSNHKVGSIYEVGTHPDFRNKGVAASLVAAAVEDSQNRGDKLTWLRTTRGYAEQMYTKLGLITSYRGVSYRFSP